ncbi:iron chelate uptake ABC transporter family permease subunit [Nonomuraea sp. 10N515B]|uniref:iron chelate uptake ABC transporter family permease subunit n=1 Tax=Nonomuraea sp. 10N515B TaxID=3457422 RepID=UPI003FCD56FA
MAPHATRALVGAHHARVLPVAALLGGLLVRLADTLGRTVIAPAEVPAGLVTALNGTPYFAYLLWRART